MIPYHSLHKFLTSVCPVPKAQVCVCQGGEANFLLIFTNDFLKCFTVSSKYFKGEDIPMPTNTFYNRWIYDTDMGD
jgi:hypothetical protein